MASGPSKAYRDFSSSLNGSLTLLSIDRQHFKDPPSADQREAVEALRGGALVLVVGSFEAFLRDVFEERIDHVAKLPSFDFSHLPSQMKATNVFGILEGAMRKGGESKRADRVPEVQAAAGKVASGVLTAELFADTQSNPNPDTVKGLFTQVGYTDLFLSITPRFQREWGAPIAKNFVRDELKSVVNARHIVAHGQQALHWTRGDVRTATRFLRTLGRTLDDELRIYLNGKTSTMR